MCSLSLSLDNCFAYNLLQQWYDLVSLVAFVLGLTERGGFAVIHNKLLNQFPVIYCRCQQDVDSGGGFIDWAGGRQ